MEALSSVERKEQRKAACRVRKGQVMCARESVAGPTSRSGAMLEDAEQHGANERLAQLRAAVASAQEALDGLEAVAGAAAG